MPRLFSIGMVLPFAAGITLVLCYIGLEWRQIAVASAGDTKTRKLVQVSASAAKPDNKGRLVVTILLDIKEGHYILANPVQNIILDGHETKVTIGSGQKLLDVKIEYPTGKRVPLFEDESF